MAALASWPFFVSPHLHSNTIWHLFFCNFYASSRAQTYLETGLSPWLLQSACPPPRTNVAFPLQFMGMERTPTG